MNMTLKTLLFTSLFVFCSSLYAGEPTTPESTYFLSKQRITELSERALDGSKEAALSLSRFYSNVSLDLDASLKWAIIGAENGDPDCMYTAFAFLEKRESKEDRRRAAFWLGKAAAMDYKPAADHKNYRSSQS